MKKKKSQGEYDDGHLLFIMEVAKLAGIKCTRKQIIKELDELNKTRKD